MFADAIAVDALSNFRVQEIDLGTAACPADPGFCIHDDILWLDEACSQKGVQGELNGGGIAAWVGDQPCGLDLLPVDFCQAVDGFLLQLWCLVLTAIPVGYEQIRSGRLDCIQGADPRINAEEGKSWVSPAIPAKEKLPASLKHG